MLSSEKNSIIINIHKNQHYYIGCSWKQVKLERMEILKTVVIVKIVFLRSDYNYQQSGAFRQNWTLQPRCWCIATGAFRQRDIPTVSRLSHKTP